MRGKRKMSTLSKGLSLPADAIHLPGFHLARLSGITVRIAKAHLTLCIPFRLLCVGIMLQAKERF